MDFLKKLMKKSSKEKKVSKKEPKKIKISEVKAKKISKKIEQVIEKQKPRRGRPPSKIKDTKIQEAKNGKIITTNQSQQDQLIEIKKISKQDSEKKIYKVKDYVVYPKHGVGQIIAIENSVIAEIEVTNYKIQITKDKLVLSIPVNQQINLRPVSSVNQINKAISILKGKAKIRRTMWSRRAQEYDQKINSGEIYQIAEVVRDLNKNTDMPVDQSYSERQLFEKAYDRLMAEVAVSLKLENIEAKKKLDKALGKKEVPVIQPLGQ